MIVYITGGERSGKSSFALKIAKELSERPVYIATARRWDDDFEKRIERHKAERDETWQTIEEEKKIGEIDFSGKTAVIDCVTLWLTNLFTDSNGNVEQSLEYAKEQIDLIERKQGTAIVISNELGMGVHAATYEARKFVELQGWVNQYIAVKSQEAYLMVSGIPIRIK